MQKRIDYITNIHSKANKDIRFINILYDSLKQYGQPWPHCDGGCAPSAGMKKIKKFIIYYGVKAELDYKNQIFLPFKLTLKAKALAKPFGGRIGPEKSADPLLSPNTTAQELQLPQYTQPHLVVENVDKKHTPNYSRYPGDELGLRSKLVHYYWTNLVRDSDKNLKQMDFYLKEGRFNIDRDPMAGPEVAISTGTNMPVRQWEVAAVAPDLFDITYFTILPYYHYDYFPRLTKPGGILSAEKPYVRGT